MLSSHEVRPDACQACPGCSTDTSVACPIGDERPLRGGRFLAACGLVFALPLLTGVVGASWSLSQDASGALGGLPGLGIGMLMAIFLAPRLIKPSPPSLPRGGHPLASSLREATVPSPSDSSRP